MAPKAPIRAGRFFIGAEGAQLVELDVSGILLRRFFETAPPASIVQKVEQLASIQLIRVRVSLEV